MEEVTDASDLEEYETFSRAPLPAVGPSREREMRKKTALERSWSFDSIRCSLSQVDLDRLRIDYSVSDQVSLRVPDEPSSPFLGKVAYSLTPTHGNEFIVVMCYVGSILASTPVLLRSRLASRSGRRIGRSVLTAIILARGSFFRSLLRSRTGKRIGSLLDKTGKALVPEPGVSLWFFVSFAGTTTDGERLFCL